MTLGRNGVLHRDKTSGTNCTVVAFDRIVVHIAAKQKPEKERIGELLDPSVLIFLF
jgi:hypothetical protein